jgi:4-hydroxymandelate oxidase
LPYRAVLAARKQFGQERERSRRRDHKIGRPLASTNWGGLRTTAGDPPSEEPEPPPPEVGFLSLGDLPEVASHAIPPALWNYVQGGAAEEVTLHDNRAAFHRRTLLPRALVDIQEIDPTTSILGTPVAAPFFVCPMAYHGSIHPEGELGTARAASRAGILAAFSTLSTASLEEIAAAAPEGPHWFQLYLQPDFTSSQRLVQRAERAGYSAIVLTVDLPVLANRDRQRQGGFALARWPPLGNGTDIQGPPRTFEPRGRVFTLRAEAATGWDVVERLREVTRLPIVIKGILSVDDARRAVEHGARGIVVSNHGGRQLDGAPASLDMLAAVVTEVGSSAEVYLDGGVRRGSDIVTALALGARAVGLGRPFLWGLGVAGTEGVARVISLLKVDLATTMALTGCRQVSAIDASVLGPWRGRPE